MKKLILLSLVAVFLFTGPLAFAWEKGAFGFLYKIDPVGRLWYNPYSIFPTDFNPDKRHSIGVVYNFASRVALKISPLFTTLNGVYTNDQGADLGEYTMTALGGQIDVPISFFSANNFDFYIAPAVRATIANADIEIPPENDVQETIFMEMGGIVNFGGQFMVTKNFAIFGEWGVAFVITQIKDTIPPVETVAGWSVHTDQAGIGIIFFLGR